MKSLAIVLGQGINFPLAEGQRKQAWWTALGLRERYDVSFYAIAPGDESRVSEVDGIRLFELPRFSYPMTADIAHFFGCPAPDLFVLLEQAKVGRVVVSTFDGELGHFWGDGLPDSIQHLMRSRISRMILQTRHQLELARPFFAKERIELIPPLLPELKRVSAPSPQPSLLFMSHLSAFKGIGEVLDAFEILEPKYPELELTIADSAALAGSEEIRRRIARMNARGARIQEKGVVDPASELSKAWVYLYPIHSEHDTLSVPLSLIESIQVGTPFICTRLAGIAQYFESDYLLDVPPTGETLAARIEVLFRTRELPAWRARLDNDQVLRAIERCYAG